MLEPELAVRAFSRNYKKVSLSSSHDPFTINTHVKGSNGISKSWKESFSVLTDLLVKPNLTIQWADSKSALDSCGYFIELRISLIGLI